MKALSAKLGVIFIGLVIFGYAEVWGADWRLYSRDDEYIRRYDAENMMHPSEKTAKVWLRQEYTKKGMSYHQILAPVEGSILFRVREVRFYTKQHANRWGERGPTNLTDKR